MARTLRLRRGTKEDYRTFIGAEGEVTYDEDKKTVRVHDGEAIGGFPLTKNSQARGWTLQEHFVNSGTWTKLGKPDLKRIIVHCYGGGGGGGNNTSGGSGAGSGGYGYVELEATAITPNVAVTIGGGGTPTNSGGATYFGSYILSNGGDGGQNSDRGVGGDPGRSYGAGVIEMGGFAGNGGGYSATAQSNFGWMYGTGGGPGGRRGDAIGVRGGGGGSSGGDGAQGSVLVQEIYGEV